MMQKALNMRSFKMHMKNSQIKFQPFRLIRRHKRKVALTLAFLFFSGMIRPNQLLALTGGPSTPESSAPSKLTSSGMVDPFTGNLDYNVPLMKVGDYPLSLSYNADISMDQESTWVGLGWTLNPGSISRSVRGLPDDFKGNDKIKKDFNTKPNIKAGLSAGLNLEAFGVDAAGALGGAANIGATLGLYYDNYQGIGLNYSLAPSITVSSANKGVLTASMGMNGGSHKNGVSLTPSLSVPQRIAGMENLSISTSFNSLSGLKSININAASKNNSGNYGLNFNSFSDRSYKPKINFPMTSTQGTFSFSVGGEAFGIFGSASLTGYYSQQHLKKRHKKVPAYGYLYSDAAKNNPGALLDFKREKDGPYTSNKPNLPIPNYTYDVFNISGSGLSGSFRAHRGDVGVVYDHRVKSLGGDKAVPAVGGLSLSGEVGGGNLAKVGIDLKTNNSVNTSGIWTASNKIVNRLAPVSDASEKDYEPFYFQMVGEKLQKNNDAYYSAILGQNPAKVRLSNDPKAARAYATLHAKGSGSNKVRNKLYKKQREKRKQAISYLTAAKADYTALNRQIKSYPLNETPLDPTSSSVNSIDRMKGKRKNHHLSQLTINKQGKRYIYGVPTYNWKKKEVSFNVKDTQGDCDNGFVGYNAGKSNSTDNDAGKNNYFSATTTPAYAYSYLLSSVVSDNYVDVSGDGPTPDDMGTYTRFNYSRVHKKYKWRSPFRKDKANYQENKYSLDNDNMANYVYGTKEIWYLNSMETRNYVAKFIVTDRKDGMGVKGENGGKDSNQKLKKLSKIELYSRTELKKNGDQATPLKTVHFKYDYSLCPGVPNHDNANKNANNGKLTLKKVYFTYGDSEKGRFSPYSFTYHSGKNNPSYKLKSNDRFGFYKENSCQSGKMDNGEFPYVNQDTAKTNDYIRAWKLKEIQVPSGGKIDITYESDDYAYVQDKRAMQMFKVAGFADKPNPGKSNMRSGNTLYDKAPYKVNNYLFFDLEKPVQSLEELKAYLPDENHLYFKTKLDVIGSGKNPSSDKYEYISGFAKYNDFGLYQKSKRGSSYSVAWIKLGKVEIGDYLLPYNYSDAHPIAKRAWIYGKNHIPKHAFNRSDATDKLKDQFTNAMKTLTTMMSFVKSLNSKLIKRGFAQKVKLDKSFIRLNSPDGSKLGGGHRVSKIEMSDSWSKMAASGQSSTYGKVYDYSTVRNGRKISSGVIAYEPRIGREENPFYQPVFYKHNGDRLFMTKPFGESFFPGPTVGYSRIEIRDLPRPNANPAPAGYKVREFYTAKDFPVITERTNLQDEHHRPSPAASLNPFKFKYNEKRTVTQGYKVVLNDMHGKPKAKYTYRHGSQVPLNGMEYKYHLNGKGQLDNKVKVVKKDKSIKSSTMGVDVDFVIDSRQQKSVTEMKGVYLNFDGFLASIVPILIPDPLPSYKKETTLFRSIVAAKVIRKRGIVDEVIAYKNGAKLKTENLAFDAITGKPLVKRTEDKYGNYKYQTQIPAHHQYSGMGPAYQNSMASFEKIQVTNGEITDNAVSRILTKGDKLYWERSGKPGERGKAWVLKSNNNRSVLIDMQGNLLSDKKYNFTVVRSGYDDKAGTTVGTITSLENPLKGNSLNLNQNLKVISAGAKEYRQDWQTYAGYTVKHTPTECNCENKLLVEEDYGQPAISSTWNKYSDFAYMMLIIMNKEDGAAIKHGRAVNLIGQKSGEQGKFVSMEKEYIGNRLFVTFKVDGKGEEHCTFRFWNLGSNDFPRNGKFFNFRYEKKNPYNCDDIHHFKVDYAYPYKDTVYAGGFTTKKVPQVVTKHDTTTLAGYSECFPVAVCEETELKTQYDCKLKPGDVVNPFILGLEGIWKPYKQYDYHAQRMSGRIQQSGYYKNFTPFSWSGNPANDWVWKKQTTLIDPLGRRLEEKDPLGNYTSNIYGYNYSMIIASINNAPHDRAGFEGFEDYRDYDGIKSFGDCEPDRHTYFEVQEGVNVFNTSGPKAYINGNHSHTGEYSAQVFHNASIEMKRKTSGYTGSSNQSQSKTYTLQPDDYVGIFTPEAGKYHISTWVKDDNASNNFNTVTYDAPYVRVLADGNPIATLRTKGQVIDEWQQISGNVDIPSGTKEVTIRLGTDNIIAYFDDFRVHPYDAQMEAYVYDPLSLRHIATLGPNNYASFFQYDETGEFIGAKQETSKGIMSVRESRQGKFKADK